MRRADEMDEAADDGFSFEALRIQHILEETLDRNAGQSEEARAEALARALEVELDALSAEARAAVVERLNTFNGEALDDPVESGVRARAVTQLQEEVERLRRELDAMRAHAATKPAASGDFAERVATILVGSVRDAQRLLAEDDEASEKLVEQLRVIMRFVGVVGRSFLSATAEPDTTMTGRIENSLAAEIQGRAPKGSFAALLEQIQYQVGGHLLAFREACDAGAQNLLRQLSPAAIAGESARESVSVAGWRPFSAREQWERFEQKFESLRRADNIFETYFDGAFRKAVLRLTRQGEERGGAASRGARGVS